MNNTLRAIHNAQLLIYDHGKRSTPGPTGSLLRCHINMRHTIKKTGRGCMLSHYQLLQLIPHAVIFQCSLTMMPFNITNRKFTSSSSTIRGVMDCLLALSSPLRLLFRRYVCSHQPFIFFAVPFLKMTCSSLTSWKYSHA